jgi:hypothetical protein
MPRFIIEDENGNPEIVAAEGFVPDGAQGAPVGEYAQTDLSKISGAWVIDESKKAARLEAERVEKEKAAAREYLASSDWYVIRQMDTGVACPNDVALKRQEARNKL